MANKKEPKIDGFGSNEKQKVSNAIRQVWQRTSYARKICVKRCTDSEGYGVCEICKQRTPKLKIDHKNPVGPLTDDGALIRLFCSSSGLQGLCNMCHKLKTKSETQARKSQRQAKKQDPQQLLLLNNLKDP